MQTSGALDLRALEAKRGSIIDRVSPGSCPDGCGLHRLKITDPRPWYGHRVFVKILRAPYKKARPVNQCSVAHEEHRRAAGPVPDFRRR